MDAKDVVEGDVEMGVKDVEVKGDQDDHFLSILFYINTELV